MGSEPSSTPRGRRNEPARSKPRSSAVPESPAPPASAPEPQATAAQQPSQWSEAKIRALLGSVSDFICLVRKDGVVLESYVPKNSGFTFSPQGLLGKRIMDLLPIQIARQAMHYLEKALRIGQTQIFTCPYLVADKTRDFEARITPTGPLEAIAVVRDVTARKLSEREILEISNQEQTRIGQDLHDGLGQHLTGITFLTKALEKKLEARSLPEANEAAEIGRLVLQALSQTRNLARGLFPVELESSELTPAFRELAATVEKLFNITCVLESDESVAMADRTAANHLFRLAQEAINNSVKHGKAKRVVISLKAAPTTTTLTIRDNGLGFEQETLQSKGLGLRIMNYRAQKIGATLEIRAAEGGGTVVTCCVPNPAT